MVSGYFEASPVFGWIVSLAVNVVLAGSYYALFGAWLSTLARRGPVSPLVVAAGNLP